MNPKYPIYIVSKGRYESLTTARALDKMNTPYRIAVESHEYDLYVNKVGKEKVLKLPFSNHGEGPTRARVPLQLHLFQPDEIRLIQMRLQFLRWRFVKSHHH